MGRNLIEGRLGILTAVFEAVSTDICQEITCRPKPFSGFISFSGTSLGCCASAPTSGRGSTRWTASKHNFGLVFILPGVVGNLPAAFATFAAYGDFATGLLAMLALLTVRIRPLFWLFVVAFNLVGAADIIIDYYHANQVGLPALAGELGATYAIPIIYVPLLMITHVVAFYLLMRPQFRAARALARDTADR